MNPMAVHYGERDVSGPDNNSASDNQTVELAWRDLQEIYNAFDASAALKLLLTPNRAHEMDVRLLREFLS